MSLKYLFVPETIKTFHSDYNGDLKLIKFLGELRLDSAGLTQSGSVMVWIWSQGIRHLLPKDYQPESILLLGLGGRARDAMIVGVTVMWPAAYSSSRARISSRR